MKVGIHSLVQAFAAQHIHLLLLQLFWEVILGLANQLIDVFVLVFAELLHSHPANRAIDISEHFQALQVDEVSTLQIDVSFGGEMQQLHANRALRLRGIFDAFVVLIADGDTISASKAVLQGLLGASPTHPAGILPLHTSTQWWISSTLSALLSQSRHFRHAYLPNQTSHFWHFKAGYCTSLHCRHLTLSTFSNSMRYVWHPFLNWKSSSWHNLQGQKILQQGASTWPWLYWEYSCGCSGHSCLGLPSTLQYFIIFSMMDNSKKQDIIIELGTELIRVGLVGDKIPRKTIKVGLSLAYPSHPEDLPKLTAYVQQLVYNIFFSYINTSLTNKTVIIVEKVYTDRRLLEMMAHNIFKFKIDKIEMALSCVSPLYLTGSYSGIVVSGGASCIEIMPIYEGYPLMRQYFCIPSGTCQLSRIIRDQLALQNTEVPLEFFKGLPEDDISDIKHTLTFNASSQPIMIPLRKQRLKFTPSSISLSKIFFGDYDNQQNNLSYSFLKVLEELPVKCLDEICRNVVFAGGLWRIKGMATQFKKHLKEHLGREGSFEKLNKLQIQDKLSFVSWGFNPSEVSFIGSSIGASIRSLDHLCLKKSQYVQNGYVQKIMKNYFLNF